METSRQQRSGTGNEGNEHPLARLRTLRAIAAFEAVKGFAALAAIVGVVDLMHHDVRRLVIELIGRFHLTPEARFPSILLHYAELLPNADVRPLIFIATGYILIRFVEACGLWYEHTWGEWLGALSGALYVPFEVRHLVHRPSVISAAVLAVNLFVVAFLAFQLWRRREKSRAAAQGRS